MGTVILGTGSCLPERVVTNHDLAEIVETNDEWIRTRTGIKTRRIAAAGEETYRLAARAAEQALAMAGVAAADLDLIVVGTITSHMLMPSTACFVQKEIGATKAFAFDLNAACPGFLYGLDVADQYVRADPSRKILVIGAETLSTRTNWEDRNTCVLFGDGAGAAVVGGGPQGRGMVGSVLCSDGRLWSLLHMHAPVSNNADLEEPDHPGVHIIMEGREVFKYAVKAMETSISDLLHR